MEYYKLLNDLKKHTEISLIGTMDDAFLTSVEKNLIEYVKILLIDDRVDPKTHHSHAMAVVTQKDYPEMLEILLMDGRADPSVNNDATLQWAILKRNKKISKLLKDDSRVDKENKYQKKYETMMAET